MELIINFFINLKTLVVSFFGFLLSLADLHRYGFAQPANNQMAAIVEMFYTTGQSMMYIFVFIVALLWGILVTRNEGVTYPIQFKRWQETLIDIGVIFIPMFIIYYLTVPAVGFLLHLDRFLQEVQTVFTIEVIGHQWYWSYFLDCIQNPVFLEMYYVFHSNLSEIDYILHDYNNLYQFDFDQIMDLDAPAGRKYLTTTKALVLPVLHYIKVLITSEDVIHSWALPQLGIKVDAIPGRLQLFLLNSNYCGIFYGQCSELCGVNHAFMPINVEFVKEYQFFDWYFKNIEVRPYKLFLSDLLMDFSVDTSKKVFSVR